MRILLAVTAAALTTAALAFPAAASTVGCKNENPINDSLKATACDVRDQQTLIAPRARARGAMAYAPRAHSKKVVRSSKSIRRQPATPGLSDTEGVKGGSSN